MVLVALFFWLKSQQFGVGLLALVGLAAVIYGAARLPVASVVLSALGALFWAWVGYELAMRVEDTYLAQSMGALIGCVLGWGAHQQVPHRTSEE